MSKKLRRDVRKEARELSLSDIQANAKRLGQEAADLQAMACAWRKAYRMEQHRRERMA